MNRLLLSSKAPTRRTETSKSSSSNKPAKIFGATFIALTSILSAIVLYQAGTATNSHIGRQPLKIEHRTEVTTGTPAIRPDDEGKEINFVIPDQDQENERLVLQRDTERTVAANMKKPSNYRDGFTCDFLIDANKLKKIDCEGNSVFERSVKLALEKANLNTFKTSVKHKFSIQIKV